ncbi:ABC transporter substrate-binding protein [Cupriavidus pinatubonensis]|uniref:ABC transporter substrate-binding protein n=1 Tax=Cupriavidus pinatubonensis TaxID=248026 RepID=UPI00112CC9C7|nr:ABC transporter substrate-binding protein [Cupriavidus pinatubonensis]TPQ31739.1 amino acid ABC transporter substrate-binding protein [Cupriavidus pinatubonensis]
MTRESLWIGALASSLLACGTASAACTTTIGSVMSLTGSLGVLGQQIAKGAQLAVADLDAAGGVNHCTPELSLLDDQTSASVGVDAAKKLVDVQHVPAIVGALSSGVSAAILTSVTTPGKVVLISPASTSPTFTELAKAGKTGGYWFRTTPSDALQGVAMAKVALDAGYRKVAVVYLNNAYGQGLSAEFAHAFTTLGGTVTQNVVYNPSQPSYRSEVDKALKPAADALLLIGYPGDGTTIAREWISAGGTQKFLLPDGLESQDFVNDVGAQYMKNVRGTAPGSVTTPSLDTFRQEYRKKFGELPTQAYIPNAYDGTVLVGLAMDYAGSADGTAIRDSLRKVTDPRGEKIYAGVAELKKAERLIAQKKSIQYIGASGPLQFDKYGDINSPMVVWSVDGTGKVKHTSMVTVDEIAKLRAKMAL